MQNHQKLLVENTVKYSLILLVAISLSAIAYTSPFLNCQLLEESREIVNLHQRWMSHSHSFFSWYISASYICAIKIGFLIYPFVLVVILPLNLFKRDWLPKNDLSFIRPLFYWVYSVLLTFLIMLFAQLLEKTGVL